MQDAFSISLATMTENCKPIVWIIDSSRTPLAECGAALDTWADVLYFPANASPDWDNPPDAILFSAEIAGGANGPEFARLVEMADAVPLIAVAGLRSLAQALSFFRSGAADYLALPLDPDDAKERTEAAIERANTIAMRGVMVELEPVDPDPGVVSLTLSQHVDEPAADKQAEEPRAEEEVDILAELPAEDEPVAVDGLPIPSLWDELPCGLLVFDSEENLAFANQPALELFGAASIAHLEDALANKRHVFAAYSANNKPLPDNQWPHILAVRTRTARSALVSIEKPDKRRAWLRLDCLPHIHDGAISRVLLTAVNLTGDLPPLAIADAPAPQTAPAARKSKAKKRGKK